jgi:hypothetical protein
MATTESNATTPRLLHIFVLPDKGFDAEGPYAPAEAANGKHPDPVTALSIWVVLPVVIRRAVWSDSDWRRLWNNSAVTKHCAGQVLPEDIDIKFKYGA